MKLVLLIAAGLVSGVISGMGIGGGIVLIPVLTGFLGFDQKIAQGINLLYFIPTAAAALVIHFKNKTVELKTALKLISTGVIGAGIGAYCVRFFSSRILSRGFAVFLILVGCYEIFSGLRERKHAKSSQA